MVSSVHTNPLTNKENKMGKHSAVEEHYLKISTDGDGWNEPYSLHASCSCKKYLVQWCDAGQNGPQEPTAKEIAEVYYSHLLESNAPVCKLKMDWVQYWNEDHREYYLITPHGRIRIAGHNFAAPFYAEKGDGYDYAVSTRTVEDAIEILELLAYGAQKFIDADNEGVEPENRWHGHFQEEYDKALSEENSKAFLL